MEEDKTFESVEIRVVNNGYWVGPGLIAQQAHGSIPREYIHVFESFESLTKWLKEKLKKPNVMA